MSDDGFDHDRFPFELKRGGLTLGVPEEVDDDMIVIVFMTDAGKQAGAVWVDQAAPLLDDIVRRDAIGLDADPLLWRVAARCWHACNLLAVLVSPVAPKEKP